jgi:hypothetical protein
MTTKQTGDKVLASFRKATDLDTHVRVITIDGIRVVEIRDFVPSLEEYGRGYWFPAEAGVINEVVQAMLKVMGEASR